MSDSYLLAYALSVIGGHIVVNPLVSLMQRTSGSKVGHADDPRSFWNRQWLGFWVGGTERAIVTTLVIVSPKSVPIFVGGWVAAKLAAGWTRFSGAEYASGNMIGLVGNAFSIAVAIGAGMLVAPEFLNALNGVEAKGG